MEVLKHHADFSALRRQLSIGELAATLVSADQLPVEPDLPACRGIEKVYRTQAGGFSGATWTYQCDALATPERK
ncbi:hypothetical protein J2Y48_004009 [Mycoplana sp. BE70]|nr:hypothetical protein [Mycoplana sp. BE70]